MKHVTKVSSEGQITIPEEIRECLGIEPDDTVELSYEDGQVVLRKRRLRSLEELKGILPPLGIDPDEAIRLAKRSTLPESTGNVSDVVRRH